MLLDIQEYEKQRAVVKLLSKLRHLFQNKEFS